MKHTPFILCCSILFMVGIYHSAYSQKSAAISSPLNCTDPLTWRIGSIDPHFGINRETLKKMMADVGKLWSNAAGKNIIAYSDTGWLTLNFIYGREQEITDSERELSQRIDQLKLQHFSLEHSYEQLFHQHRKKTEKYDRRFKEYMKKVESHNWMIRTRSDAKVVQDIENERFIELKKKIKTLKKELSTLGKKLNNEVKELAKLSSQLDDVANRVNELIYAYNDQFGSLRMFYQGVYIDDLNHQKINIYEFENSDKLKLVLAHEVGHALGLNHVSNPTSIMYFKMEYQNEQTLQLSEEDIRAIRERCPG